MELVETIFFLSKNDHRFLRVSNLKFFERMALTILRVKQNMKINPINTPSPPPPPPTTLVPIIILTFLVNK
jgi:hypothetical protein